MLAPLCPALSPTLFSAGAEEWRVTGVAWGSAAAGVPSQARVQSWRRQGNGSLAPRQSSVCVFEDEDSKT